MAQSARGRFNEDDQSIRLRRARSFYGADDIGNLSERTAASQGIAGPSRLTLPIPLLSSKNPSQDQPTSPTHSNPERLTGSRWLGNAEKESVSGSVRRKLHGLGLLHSHSETDLSPKSLLNGEGQSGSVARQTYMRSKRHPSDLGAADLISDRLNGRTKFTQKAKVVIHVVQPTDTLAGLSLRYGISVPALQKANRLWTNDSIQARKEIFLPVADCHRLRDVDLAREIGLIQVEEQNSGNSTEMPMGAELIDDNSEDPLSNLSGRTPAIVVDKELSEVDKKGKIAETPLVRVENLPTGHLSYFPPARRKVADSRHSSSSVDTGIEPILLASDLKDRPSELRAFSSSPRRAHTDSWEEWLGLVHSDLETNAKASTPTRRSTSESTSVHWNMPLGSSHYLRAARNALGHSLAGRLSLDAVRSSFDREYRKSIESAKERQNEANGRMELLETSSPERLSQNGGSTMARSSSHDSRKFHASATAFDQFANYHRA